MLPQRAVIFDMDGVITDSEPLYAEALDIVLGRRSIVGSFFAAIATSDMVLASKPAPDLFLLAARELGVPPRNCLALDDTPRGIAAANTAGMTTVAVRNESTARMNVPAANYVINRLREFDFAWIEALG